MCAAFPDKVGHKDIEGAKLAVEKMKKKDKKVFTKKYLVPFKCAHCGKYHIGHLINKK